MTYEDGIVGLRNNRFYCYMNACLQCLLPIHELRDYYVGMKYEGALSKGISRHRERQPYSNTLNEFYCTVFSKSSQHKKKWVLDTDFKNLMYKTFSPIV